MFTYLKDLIEDIKSSIDVAVDTYLGEDELKQRDLKRQFEVGGVPMKIVNGKYVPVMERPAPSRPVEIPKGYSYTPPGYKMRMPE